MKQNKQPHTNGRNARIRWANAALAAAAIALVAAFFMLPLGHSHTEITVLPLPAVDVPSARANGPTIGPQASPRTAHSRKKSFHHKRARLKQQERHAELLSPQQIFAPPQAVADLTPEDGG